jgi:alpha-mannosidase
MNHRHVISAMLLLAGAGASLTRADDAAKVPSGGPTLSPAFEPPPKVDLGKQPTLYVVGYAHLDTEWRWAYPQTIREFIANTLHDNFKLFEKYPSYVFNFSGSRRYQMMAEYYPEDYAKLKEYVATGRWFPCGSSVDENDANVPSAESYVRHIMYGNRYFRKEFGVASDEYMLPDCFGFPASLPSMLTHCGLKGFSTQKLTWGLAIGQIPFKVGMWEGPDGRAIVAALDPGAYVGEVKENLATSEGWAKRIDNNGAKSGVFADYHYYGTGDQGGGPKASSVDMVEQSTKTEGHTRVISGPADWMFKTITPEQAAGLPRYKGELELTEHSAGSITSESYMKRWNRKNELLADAAERAALSAWWMGAGAYPGGRIEEAWTLVLGSQMHDILPGTSLPKAYEYAWNDEVLASNMFADLLQRSVGAVADGLDTRGEGTAVVLYNPLAAEREDVVEMTIPEPEGVGIPVAVGPGGEISMVQTLSHEPGAWRIAFAAKTPSAGFAVYHVRLSATNPPVPAMLKVSPTSLENDRYLVRIDENGDVASIFDKSVKKEMLSGPARIGLHFERPKEWPAWNQDWADRKNPARSFVSGSPRITVVESGPVRAAVRVEREQEGSTFVQEIRLAGGASGDTLDFHTHIDWTTRERSVRAHFPLVASNAHSTYDIQTGVIERPVSHPKQFEYAAHQWMDTTDASGAFGASILNDCKYGSDKPDESTLRLTLLYTPGVRGGYQDQGTQDIGRHDIGYSFYSHAGDWRAARTPWHAARLNQPIRAFLVSAHEGALGASFSLLSCDNPSVMVMAAKKAEDSDRIVVRLRELSGTAAQGVKVRFPAAVSAAREIDGQEREIGAAKVEGGLLVADVHGYGLRAYAVTLSRGAGSAPLRPVESSPVTITYDADVVSSNANRSDGAMEPDRAYPAEQLPRELTLDNVMFRFGPTADGQPNAVSCKGQSVALPPGEFDRVEILAASSDADATVAFESGGKPFMRSIPSWRGYVGQWDNRRWGGNVPEQAFQWTNPLVGLDPGYIKPEAVAWHCSHFHSPTQDEHYQYCYIFRSTIDLPAGAASIKLPNAPGVKVFAVTAVHGSHDHAVAAAPLRDTLDDHAASPVRILSSGEAGNALLAWVEPAMYYREGSIHYTTDGSDPTPESTTYEKPFWLSKTTTIRSASFDANGKPGPIASKMVEVHDRTPPSVKNIWAEFQAPKIHVEFSEPVDRAAAGFAANYTLAGARIVAAELGDEGFSVTLTLDKPLPTDRTGELVFGGIKDGAGNTMSGVSVMIAARGPVYRLAAADKDHRGAAVQGVPKLPTGAGQSWSINMWVRTDRQPDDRTVIAGFGHCQGAVGGTGRYLSKFTNGIHFWSHNCDVQGKTPLDLDKWQMLTATYDGTTIRLYKNAKRIAEQAVSLSDDEPVVNILPSDPWEHKRTFAGEMREFTVWNSCLSPDSLKVLAESFKAP